MAKKKEAQAAKFYFGMYEIESIEDESEDCKRITLLYPKPIEGKDEEGNEYRDTAFKISVPAWELEAVLTNEPVDATVERNLRAQPVAKQILEILLERNVRVTEIDHIMRLVLESLSQNEQKAYLLAYGIDDKKEERMSHWDNMLKS